MSHDRGCPCGKEQGDYGYRECLGCKPKPKDTKVTHTFKVGDKVKIVGNSNHHRYNIGEEKTLKSNDSGYGWWFVGEWHLDEKDIEPISRIEDDLIKVVDEGDDYIDFFIADDAIEPIVSTTYNPVSKPSHYNQGEGIECIEYIKQVLGPEGFVAYCRGNLMKYNHRAMYKGSTVQDLEKALQYLTWATETLKEAEESK
jgi:hypothetical protein